MRKQEQGATAVSFQGQHRPGSVKAGVVGQVGIALWSQAPAQTWRTVGAPGWEGGAEAALELGCGCAALLGA